MTERKSNRWLAVATMVVYGVAYLVAWSFVWTAPAAERDGLEGVLVVLLTLPWSLLAGSHRLVVLHVGAVVNAVLLALLVVWLANRSFPAQRRSPS